MPPPVSEVFATRLGPMRLTTGPEGAVSSLKFSEEECTGAPSPLARRIQKHLDGESQDFSDVPLSLDKSSSFAQSVFEAARKIPSGQTSTYGEVAKAIGKPRGAQAVGGAMGRNPVLIIVPCHRVLGSGSSMGGFSAPGGLATKELILAAEGWGTESLWDQDNLNRARTHLLRCPHLGPIVEKVGPCTMEPLYPHHPFGALARSVLYQQLATSAAKAIEQRVKALGSIPFPSAQEILELSEDDLRKAGVSGPKIATLKRLAKTTLEGTLVPENLRLLPNTQVESQVSQIKGLGAWSARMFLLFHLGRRDVFPVKDLGIRKGVQALFGSRDLPSPEFMERKSKNWKPFRSLASWYLWRSLEL